MPLFGTIFSSGLIHIRCSSKYLQQQEGVCGSDSKQTVDSTQCTCQPVHHCSSLICDLIVVGQQWSSKHRGIRYQASDTQTILVQFILGFSLFMDLLTIRK